MKARRKVKNEISFVRIAGTIVPKFRGRRATKVIPDKRKKQKHKLDWRPEEGFSDPV
jgi:hypothetical protein